VENITFLKHDILSDNPDEQLEKHYSIIVSNPPYIAQDEMDTLQPEVKDFEPRLALTDEADGLKFYDKIFSLMSTKQLSCDYCFLEMSGSFPEKIIARARHFNFNNYQVIRDLNGIDRVLKIKFE
jgi:release factor glutamine methyltransferase